MNTSNPLLPDTMRVLERSHVCESDMLIMLVLPRTWKNGLGPRPKEESCGY